MNSGLAAELSVDDIGQRFTVNQISGREVISKPYYFDVTFISGRRVPIAENNILGRPVTVTMRTESGSRNIYGLIASQKMIGNPVSNDRLIYQVRVVPRVWFLSKRTNTRIFQDRTVVEIIGLILGRTRVPVRTSVSSTLRRLPYCVQYRETDLGFIQRILADHGIFYYFEHPNRTEQSPQNAREIASRNSLRETLASLRSGTNRANIPELSEGVSQGENALDSLEELERQAQQTTADILGLTIDGLSAQSPSGQVTSEVMVLCDQSQRYPALQGRNVLRYEAQRHDGQLSNGDVVSFHWGSQVEATAANLQGYDFTHPSSVVGASARTDRDHQHRPPSIVERMGLELQDHSSLHLVPLLESRDARQCVEMLQRKALRADGVSREKFLSPGYRFTLENHPFHEVNREFVVTTVEHDLVIPELTGEAEGNSDRPTYRNKFKCIPADKTFRPRRITRPWRQITETATVVTESPDDIMVDDLGRIKVKFHWDRPGRQPQDSSCWIRVAQGWAGSGWGTQFIPRAGMEVLVTFLDGDADHPVITGCLYNGEKMPPFGLPESKTRSGIRTQSSPEATGFNELSFEDLSGQECVTLRAQRDLQVKTLRHEQHFVGGNHETTIDGRSQVSVAGNAETLVQSNSNSVVLGNATNVHVGNHVVSTKGESMTYTGSSTTIVENALVAKIGGAASVQIGNDDGDQLDVESKGNIILNSGKMITLQSRDGIVLRVGSSVVSITDSEVRIQTDRLTLQGHHGVIINGRRQRFALAENAMIRADEIQLVTDQAVQTLGDSIELRSSRIRLSSGSNQSQDSESPASDQQTPLRMRILDSGHNPACGKRFVLSAEGSQWTGTTTQDGFVETSVPRALRTARLQVFLEEAPQTTILEYDLQFGQALDGIDSVRGVQERLARLGYYHGVCNGQMNPDTQQALRQFQQMQQLPLSGEPDTQTRERLRTYD